jgi:hypothetical protein
MNSFAVILLMLCEDNSLLALGYSHAESYLPLHITVFLEVMDDE